MQPEPRKSVLLRGMHAGDARTKNSQPSSSPPGSSPRGLPLFTLAWVVVAGIVGMGGTRRGKTRLYGAAAGVCLGLGLMAELSCGGLASSSSATPPPPVTVTVNPGLATLFADETGNAWPVAVTQQQFAATVNASTNQSVTWTVSGGNVNGSIDATGLYTAPATVPNPTTVTIMATSTAVATPGSTYVTVAPATGLGASQITVTATAVGGGPHSALVTLAVQ